MKNQIEEQTSKALVDDLSREATEAPGVAPAMENPEERTRADGLPLPGVVSPDAHSAAILEAREEERSRLAEELHDGPAQTLANAIFQIEILSRETNQDGNDGSDDLATVRRLLRRELDTLRAYMSQLRPPLAEPEELDEALRDSATSLTEYTSIPVDMRLDAPAQLLDESARKVALRVAQEALRNIGKHSGAERAWLVTASPT